MFVFYNMIYKCVSQRSQGCLTPIVILHLLRVQNVHLTLDKPLTPPTSGTPRCLLTLVKVRYISVWKIICFHPKFATWCSLLPFPPSDVALAAVLVPVLFMVLTALILTVVCAWHCRSRCVFSLSCKEKTDVLWSTHCIGGIWCQKTYNASFLLLYYFSAYIIGLRYIKDMSIKCFAQNTKQITHSSHVHFAW